MNKTSLPELPPEIFTGIGLYLSRADLASCTRASRCLHDILSPVLWSTIDDRWLYGQEPGPGQCTSDFVSADLIKSRNKSLLKNGQHIRNLMVYHVPTVTTLVSNPTLCTRLRSLDFRNCAPVAILTLDQDITNDQVLAAINPIFQYFLKIPYSGVESHDWNDQIQQRCQVARAVISLILQNAKTLTTLCLDNTDILAFFESTRAFYAILANLPGLRELRVPGEGVSIIALNQVLPKLEILHLGRGIDLGVSLTSGRVAGLHQAPHGWRLMTVEDIAVIGPAVETPPSIQTLNMTSSITIDMFRRILDHFPSMQHIYLPPFDTFNYKIDQKSWVALRQSESIEIEWTVSPDSTEKAEVPSYCAGLAVPLSLINLESPLIPPEYQFTYLKLCILWSFPLLRVRRGNRLP